MTNKILAIAGLAVIGSLVSIGSADNVIKAVVQQFGATPHTEFTAPGNIRVAQIDWIFTPDHNELLACELFFDANGDGLADEVPAGTLIVCKVSDHLRTIVGGGQIVSPGPTPGNTYIVRIDCDLIFADPTGPRCDVQDIEDVKVILVGAPTTDVRPATTP